MSIHEKHIKLSKRFAMAIYSRDGGKVYEWGIYPVGRPDAEIYTSASYTMPTKAEGRREAAKAFKAMRRKDPARLKRIMKASSSKGRLSHMVKSKHRGDDSLFRRGHR